ncbi:uncharacterized protein LOC112566176 [Pomacea canaliculata]|uniref:uncharacterized protein LOC112566176 n=1 Tax=Pomacea canaliculata TaxID=400727 RepID=UPI000D726559|nr:uncharacterized protein LOC112566176 [Pomacea canaliculata]
MTSSINTSLEYGILKTNVSAPSKDMSLISKETRKLVEMVCLSGLTTLVYLIGIPANIINCIVFWRQGLKDRMNLCLFSLAITDLAYLVSELAVLSISSFLSYIDPTLGEEYMSKAMVDGHHQQRALTTMLVLVSCIYIFTAGPNVARELIRILIPALVSDPHYYDLFLAVSAMTLLPPRLNSSIHIFVYYNRSSRYRSVLRKMLCGCGKKQPFASDLSV